MNKTKRNLWKKWLTAGTIAVLLTGIWSVTAQASGFRDSSSAEVALNAAVSGMETVENEAALLGASAFKQTAGTTTSVTVTWDQVDGANQYAIGLFDYATQETVGTPKVINATGAATQSLKISSLKAGKKYIAAILTDNDKSAQIIVKTIPGKITGLKYTSNPAKKTMKFAWNSVEYADGYKLYRYTTSGSLSKQYSSTTNYKTISVPNSFFQFGYRAYTKINGKTYYGAMKKICTANQPKINNTVTQMAGSSTISWNKISGATSYTISRSTTLNGTYKKVGTVTGTKAKITGLTYGKTYYICVTANRKSGSKTYKSPNNYVVYFRQTR